MIIVHAAVKCKLAFSCECEYRNESDYQIGQSVFSPVVAFGECPIRLKVYPSGTTATAGMHVSAYVVIEPKDDWEPDWKFPGVTYQIIAKNGGEQDDIVRSDSWTFCQKFRDRGWHDMIPRTDFNTLRSNGWLSDGKLRFWVEVRGNSLGESQRKRRKTTLGVSSMWWDMKFTDMVISAGEDGPELPCHRAVLAMRSEVFNSLLGSDMKEGRERKVAIQNTSTETLRLLLELLYRGVVPESALGDLSKLEALMALCDQYSLHDLLEECARHLRRSVCRDNVTEVLRTLNAYKQAPKVKDQLEEAKKCVWNSPELFDCLVESL